MGLFDCFRPEKWTQLGAALELTPFMPFESYSSSMCFRRIERARGYPAGAAPPTFQHWLWGKRRGTRKLLSRPALLQAMTYAASFTNDVQAGHEGCFLRMGGPSPRGWNLEALVSWACTVSRELAGAPAGHGAYR